jgi:hypothetical protein
MFEMVTKGSRVLIEFSKLKAAVRRNRKNRKTPPPVTSPSLDPVKESIK